MAREPVPHIKKKQGRQEFTKRSRQQSETAPEDTETDSKQKPRSSNQRSLLMPNLAITSATLRLSKPGRPDIRAHGCQSGFVPESRVGGR